MKIQELADLAGVSPSTVSRVFANHLNVKQDIRDKILKLAKEHGYHPRLTDKQRNVVIVTPYDSVYPVQSCVDMLLMALTQELPAHGFRLEIVPVNNLDRLDSIQFCAAAAIGTEPGEFAGWDDRFSSPLILIDRPLPKDHRGIYAVHSNEEQGMELAFRHLKDRGCKKIGTIIHGDPGTGNADLRYEALKKIYRKNRIPSDGCIYFSGPGTEKYVELTGKLLKNGADALFCPGGNAGIMLLYALSLYGKNVPDDISIIASEQTFFSRFAVPPQTTITQDYAGIAKAAAKIIENVLDRKECPEETVLPYQLIIRESVANRTA